MRLNRSFLSRAGLGWHTACMESTARPSSVEQTECPEPAAGLTAEEARFVEAAVGSILPEPMHAEQSIDAVGYLNRQFGSKARHLDVRDMYRRGIAAIH